MSRSSVRNHTSSQGGYTIRVNDFAKCFAQVLYEAGALSNQKKSGLSPSRRPIKNLKPKHYQSCNIVYSKLDLAMAARPWLRHWPMPKNPTIPKGTMLNDCCVLMRGATSHDRF